MLLLLLLFLQANSKIPFPQCGSWSDGPSGPEGETSGGGAQQKSADVPAASRPPSQDIIRLQSGRLQQGEAPWVSMLQGYSDASSNKFIFLSLMSIFLHWFHSVITERNSALPQPSLFPEIKLEFVFWHHDVQFCFFKYILIA